MKELILVILKFIVNTFMAGLGKSGVHTPCASCGE